MNEIDIENGTYLGHEICACSGNKNSMWLVVYDGKYNYYLFNACHNRALFRYKHKQMPCNDVDRGTKDAEYYSNFDNAVNNLMKVVANNGFLTRTRIV